VLVLAQRAVLFCFSGFLLAAARRTWVDGATRNLELLRVVLFLVPTRRAGWCCATRRAYLGGLTFVDF
ncbi:hypothetical protein A2U01_0060533, partial [Trifolium medium]|nr:hypothetical protein [Trifolium medium]